jgi:hypothetical protein
VQRFANHYAAVLGIAVGESLIEIGNPFEKNLLRVRGRVDGTIFVSGHSGLA